MYGLFRKGKTLKTNFSTMILFFLGLIVSYLIGSFSSAVWIGKIFYGKDVREYGSHNAGTTNTIRVLGVRPGVCVLFIDAFKGWLAVMLTPFFVLPSLEEYMVYYQVLMAVAVVVGHVWPLYTGFKGGKGVATLMGVVLALYPEAFLLSVLVFGFIFLSTRYVSLASITAAVCFPFIDIFLFKQSEPILCVFAVFMGLFIVITHRKNIGRLLSGTESKLSFSKKIDTDTRDENIADKDKNKNRSEL